MSIRFLTTQEVLLLLLLLFLLLSLSLLLLLLLLSSLLLLLLMFICTGLAEKRVTFPQGFSFVSYLYFRFFFFLYC